MHNRNIFVDDVSFDEYLIDLLQDHECSGEYAFSTRLFTLAAYDCLTALAFYDVNEPLKTLSSTTADDLDDLTEWEDLSSINVVEDDGDDEDDRDPTTRSDSRGTTRSDIETHRILAFILYLLPRSGKYGPLVDLCQNPGPCFYHSKKYAGVDLKVNFPIRFGRLIKEMNRYLEKAGAESGVAEAACYRQDVEAEVPLCEVCGFKDKEKVKWRRREWMML